MARITHGERVIDAVSGTTKAGLVAYFEAVADWLLPELTGRPVALLRAPEGVGGEVFFQKHMQAMRIAGVKEFDAALWPDHGSLLHIDSRTGLLGAAQMNVVELHTGNARAVAFGTPDRLVFDLDPTTMSRRFRSRSCSISRAPCRLASWTAVARRTGSGASSWTTFATAWLPPPSRRFRHALALASA